MCKKVLYNMFVQFSGIYTSLVKIRFSPEGGQNVDNAGESSGIFRIFEFKIMIDYRELY